jgi:subtilisin family serine protease
MKHHCEQPKQNTYKSLLNLTIMLQPCSKQHRWVDSLRKFVSVHVQGSNSGARIKVALIDDGVDVYLGDLKGKVKAGWPTEKPTSSWAPFYQSTEGHGTAMARLITTACPHVDLYVAKLKSLNKVISRDEKWKMLDDANSNAWTSTADDAASVGVPPFTYNFESSDISTE